MKYFWIALGILAVILALALCLLSLLETCTEAVILHLQDAQDRKSVV